MKSCSRRLVPAMFLSAALFTGMSVPALADVKVAVTIKPLHSLVAAIMQGAGKPELIMPGTASPHTYTLSPSRAGMLQKAGVVFQIADNFETSLTPAINQIAAKAVKVNFENVEGLKLLKFRSPHHHDDHEDGHDKKGKHDDHDKDEKHDDHAGHDKKDKHDKHDDEHKKTGAHSDDHNVDWHIWLDPQKAGLMAGYITQTLAKADPKNAALYANNNKVLQEKLKTLTIDTARQLSGLKNRQFVVFHDAYQYFEKRFGLTKPGVVNLNPQAPTSAGHMSKLYKHIKDEKAVCVFSEPQFNQKLVASIKKNTGIKSATIDPLGANFKQGPELYFELIKNLARQFSSCLKS